MAICLTTYGSRRTQDGTDYIRCKLQADTLELPTTGEGVSGLPDGARIDAGSTLDVLSGSEQYTMGQDGQWYKRGGAVG